MYTDNKRNRCLLVYLSGPLLLLVVCLKAVVGNSVGLIFAGNDQNNQIINQMEVYSGHLGYTVCNSSRLDLQPAVTGHLEPPVTGQYSAGTFLEGQGLFLCGGKTDDNRVIPQCYNKQYASTGEWKEFDLPDNLTALQSPSLVPFILAYQNNQIYDQVDQGLWMVGGYGDGFVEDSVLYNLRQSSWEPLISFPTSSISSIVKFESSTRRPDELLYMFWNTTTTVFCFCKQNATPCLRDNWICDDLLTNYIDNLNAIYDVATFISVDGTEKILVESHNLSGADVSYHAFVSGWTDGVPTLQVEQATQRDKTSRPRLTSIGGNLLAFGGDIVGLGKQNTVYMYDDSTATWNELPPMTNTRYLPTVVDVPESWLCSMALGPLPSTTSTTTTTTSSSPESSPSTVEPTSSCNKVDGRGILWIVPLGQCGFKDCGTKRSDADYASWCCDAETDSFNTTEPDRSQCIDEWVDEIGNLFEQNSTKTDIVAVIAQLLNENKDFEGGTVLKLAEYFETLIGMNESDDDDIDTFVDNTVGSMSILLGSSLAWREITDISAKHNTASSYLKSLDNAAFEWSSSQDDCEGGKEFNYNNVKAVVGQFKAMDQEMCVSFSDTNSICIQNKVAQGCTSIVSTFVNVKERMEEEQSAIFPTISDDRSLLGKQLIGMTINNEDVRIDEDVSVQITFDHKSLYKNLVGCILVPGTPVCMYWDLVKNEWSSEGCKANPSSDPDKTVCDCKHLTNFGILLDWQNKAPTNDEVLDGISMGLLSMSCVCLVLTEFLTYFQRARSSLRRMAETNRNICLFLAQLSFMFLVGESERVSCDVCTSFGAITHYFWASFFLWNLVEGYCFYSALVQVFQTKKTPVWIFYCISYITPAIIVVSTALYSEYNQKYFYLRRNDVGEVNGCWLYGSSIFGLIGLVGIVVLFNSFIAFKTIRIALDSEKRRNVKRTPALIISTSRNIIFVSIILGLSWALGLFPVHVVQQYVFVSLNGCVGIFILYYNILGNPLARQGIKDKLVRIASRYTSTSSMNSTNASQQLVVSSSKRT